MFIVAIIVQEGQSHGFRYRPLCSRWLLRRHLWHLLQGSAIRGVDGAGGAQTGGYEPMYSPLNFCLSLIVIDSRPAEGVLDH